jgi:hypothetical protein
MNDDLVNRSTDNSAAASRRWYQFRLRTIFVGMVVVGCLLVGYRAYIEPYRQQRRTMNLIKELGGTYESTAAEGWQRRLFGSEYENLTVVNLADCDKVDEYLPHVSRLPHLETLVVGGEGFTDDQLQRLDCPQTLKDVVFDSTSVSPEQVHRWWEDRLKRGHAPNTCHRDRRVVGELEKSGVTVRQWAGSNASHELEKRFGSKFFDRVLAVDVRGSVDEMVVKRLNRLYSLWAIYLTNTQAGDTDLLHLAKLDRPEQRSLSLYLKGTKVSDAGLAHLRPLTWLHDLDLRDTKVADAGLTHLAPLGDLWQLDLSGTNVTDAGLGHLATFPSCVSSI